MPTQAELLARISGVMWAADSAINTKSDTGNLDAESRNIFRAKGLSLIRDLFGEDHHYFKDFNSRADGVHNSGYRAGRGIISAIEDDVKAGWLTQTTSLIAADLFTDFLEMAQHLLDEGYKDAAAVIAGSSLEGHLRRMAITFKTDPNKPSGDPKKTEVINADLYKANAYTLTEQKQITAWLGTRNDAAHAHYDKVLKESVSLMIQGIRHFMTLHPA